MGLFDIFNAEARKQKSFDKMRAKLVSKNMQHDDRMWCIQQLAEMDNEEATRALFADDRGKFERETASWPGDIQKYALALAFGEDEGAHSWS